MTKVFVHAPAALSGPVDERLGAEWGDLGDVGHWRTIEQPTRAADLLVDSWGTDR